MKIVVLMDLAKKCFGGGVYSIFKFAAALAKRGHYVYMYWVNVPYLYNKQYSADRLKIHKRLKFSIPFKGASYFDGIIESIYNYFILDSFVANIHNTVDLIIGHQTKTAISAAHLGIKYGIPTANFIFESPNWLSGSEFEEWHEKWNKLSTRREWQMFRESLEDSTAIIPISYLTKHYAEIWLKREISNPVYPGVDIVRNLSSCPPYLHRKHQVMYIGRLKRHKNVKEIIIALSQMKQSPKLLVCGDGPERERLVNLAKKLHANCEFTRGLTDVSKWRLISESKFMIFPSSFEGFGVPPMEALACGIPCICTDIPIFHEVYGDKVEYFEEHNTEALAGKMQYLLANPDYCEKRGEEGRQYVKQRFSWDKSAEKIERILEENTVRNT